VLERWIEAACRTRNARRGGLRALGTLWPLGSRQGGPLASIR